MMPNLPPNFKALEATILARMERAASAIGQELVAATREVNDVAREWDYFTGRRTVRNTPSAPMPVVEGAYRDNIDSGEASAAITTGNTTGLKSTVVFQGLSGEKEETMLSTKPILEVTFNEFDFEQSFKDNF